ncbi:hypothetical protein AEGHOMDF_3697 [Methylobacterium soli]|nr:hypothetical protein AEGHOMDF_3697 [Methylobacterium soli]
MKITFSQSVATARPFSTTKPAGVCIQELADRIQKAETSVPKATMQVETKCSRSPTRSQPNSMIPRKPASRKKAVMTSYWISGPSTFPVKSE